MTSVASLDGETTGYTYDKTCRCVETKTGSSTATGGTCSITFSYSYNRNVYITGEKRIGDGKGKKIACGTQHQLRMPENENAY